MAMAPVRLWSMVHRLLGILRPPHDSVYPLIARWKPQSTPSLVLFPSHGLLLLPRQPLPPWFRVEFKLLRAPPLPLTHPVPYHHREKVPLRHLSFRSAPKLEASDGQRLFH
uniref:Predicted protein n=1 Tax=Hordeum vulgare subsp. vulgare TaxID=112509 RepID=F2E3K6_HORVV|nr:predicted protein [Hordeum vulgare subsp. vulgare]